MTANAFPARAFPKRAFPGRAFPAVARQVAEEQEQPTGGWLYADELPWALKPLVEPVRIEVDDDSIEIRPRPTPSTLSPSEAAALLAESPLPDVPPLRQLHTETRFDKARQTRAFARLGLSEDEWILILIAGDLL